MTHKDDFKGLVYDSLEKQVGGKHYRGMKIQPAQFINENKLLFAEGMLLNISADTSLRERRKILRKRYTI